MIRTVLVDDELDATQVLKTMLEQFCDGVEVVGVAHNPEDGIKKIQELKPNLVFLDVEMPGGSGFDVLKKITDRDFDVIFSTAHNHYALKAIKYSALDYLMKPVDIDELTDAIEKVKQKNGAGSGEQIAGLINSLNDSIPNKIAVPTRSGYKFISVSDIIRIEADGSYCHLYLKELGDIMISKNLKEMESILSDHTFFFRAHNSHVINLNEVSEFSREDGGFVVMSDKSKVQLSRSKKDELIERLKVK